MSIDTYYVAADTSHARNAEVKLFDAIAQTGAAQERHQERSEAAVDVHSNLVLASKGSKVCDRVLPDQPGYSEGLLHAR